MRVLTAAVVCAVVLYLLDAYFYDGMYFEALSKVLTHAIRGH